MQRKRNKAIKLSDKNALEKLLQETYTDANLQITSTNDVMGELTTNTPDPSDVDDATKIAKEKANLLKVRDSAIRLKLDISKIMNEVLKHDGDVGKSVDEVSKPGNALDDDFLNKIRQSVGK